MINHLIFTTDPQQANSMGSIATRAGLDCEITDHWADRDHLKFLGYNVTIRKPINWTADKWEGFITCLSLVRR